MAKVYQANELRKGNTFFYKDNIYLVLDHSFKKVAMREGIVKCKVKNLRTGSITEEVLTGEKLEQALVKNSKMTYSYDDGPNMVFMDMDTFDTVSIPTSSMTGERNFITEGQEIVLLMFEDEVLGATLPDQITVNVKEAEEAVQGNSVTTAEKQCGLDSGFQVQVPQFIKTGEKIIIDTATGKYVSRGK